MALKRSVLWDALALIVPVVAIVYTGIAMLVFSIVPGQEKETPLPKGDGFGDATVDDSNDGRTGKDGGT
jgi:hypothetical protein